jgi:hypothetical protein
VRARSLVFLLLTTNACASAAQTPPTTTSPDASLSWDDPAPALVCQDQRQFWAGSCAGEFTLTLHADQPIRPLRATLTADHSGSHTLYEYEDRALVAGQRWQLPRPLRIHQADRWTLTLTYVDASGQERQIAASASVTNPAREAVQAQCVECKGELRAWGILGREWCNCGTKDAGQPCDDERDCEGACLAIKDATPRDKPGVCAPRKTMFGCRSYVMYTPNHPAGRVTHYICGD